MNKLFTLVSATGKDAKAFLQGQLTQDIDKLEETSTLPAAWCTARGRVIVFMRLIAARDEIVLVLPSALAAAVMKRLQVYRLRAAVDLNPAAQNWQLLAVSAEQDLAALDARGLLPPAGAPFAYRRHAGVTAVAIGGSERCVEVYGTREAFTACGLQLQQPLTDARWMSALVNAGIPYIAEKTTEKYTPHMLNLDLLGAVSFTKGCYAGQEIVARTQHLGRPSRRLMHYRLPAGSAEIGDKMRYRDRDVGDVINVSAADLLGVVGREAVDENLLVNGGSATPVDLPYVLPQDR